LKQGIRRHQKRVTDLRREALLFKSAETEKIVNEVARVTGDETVPSYVQFSPTVISHIRRIINNGGSIITDTELLCDDFDASLIAGSGVSLMCYINDKSVMASAEQRRITRAEVAVDTALVNEGNKLFVIGSAPAALNPLLLHRRQEPLSDVCVLCTINSYAGSMQLKEKLRESGIPFIVTRGKNGGTAAAGVLLGAIIRVIKGL